MSTPFPDQIDSATRRMTTRQFWATLRQCKGPWRLIGTMIRSESGDCPITAVYRHILTLTGRTELKFRLLCPEHMGLAYDFVIDIVCAADRDPRAGGSCANARVRRFRGMMLKACGLR